MLHYANRSLEYYEAPIVRHSMLLLGSLPFMHDGYNFITSGELHDSLIYRNSYENLSFIVGPYLNYAESFYDEAKLASMKKKLGKHLTVFPGHSIICFTTVNYNAKEFVNECLSEAKKFDSISVCVNYNDINSETIQLFKSNGVKIVTAGFGEDPSFAKRLKTIMLLTDAIATNSWGSQILHALSFNKPVKIIGQDFSLNRMAGEKVEMTEDIKDIFLKAKSMFEIDNYCVTQKQLDLFKPFVDFTKIMTREEMGAIFDLSKHIIQRCDYKKTKYINSIRETYRYLQRATSPDEKLQFCLMQKAAPPGYDEYLKRIGM
jgi:hypothetical protein